MTLSREPRSQVPVGPGVLASWSSIARYFDCNERTVKRWEEQRGLPVHRAPGGKRGYVFAYTHELDEWLRATRESSSDIEVVPSESAIWAQENSPTVIEAQSAEKPPDTSSPVQRPLGSFRRAWAAWGAAILIAAGFCLAILGPHHLVGAKSAVAASASITREHIPLPGAEKLYLRGRYFWNLRTADSLSKAIDAYTQSIVKDPLYAEPYAGLAEAYELQPQFAGADLAESFERAKSAADRAIQLNPDLATAHRAKAFALWFWDWDVTGSDIEFKRALALDPNSPETHHWYASVLYSRLESKECLQQIDEALKLDPASGAIAADAAFFRANFEDLDEGVRVLREIERTQPTLSTPPEFLSELDFARGDFPAYVNDVRVYASITRNRDDAALADAMARGWTRSGTRGLLEGRASALRLAFEHGTEHGFVLGETLLLLGRAKEALPYFRTASLKVHDIGLVVIKDSPQVRPLIHDPEYALLFAELDKRFRGGHLPSSAAMPFAFRLPQLSMHQSG